MVEAFRTLSSRSRSIRIALWSESVPVVHRTLCSAWSSVAKSPAGEAVIELLLGQPGCEFPVSVEAEARAHMSNDVMDGSKSVVRAAEVAAQQWVTAVPFPGARGDLQHPISAHCADQLIVASRRGFHCG